MGEYVKIEGLKELRRELRKIDPALNKEIGNINRRVVNTYVVPAARRLAQQRTNPRAGRRVIDSIRGIASQTRAQIVGGGARAPEFFGHNYGSMQRRMTGVPKGHTTQFPVRAPRRGRGTEGYIFEPAVRQSLPQIMDAYEQMLDGLIRSLDLPQ